MRPLTTILLDPDCSSERICHTLMTEFCMNAQAITLKQHIKRAEFSREQQQLARELIPRLLSDIDVMGGDDYFEKSSRNERIANQRFYMLNFSLMLCARMTADNRLYRQAYRQCKEFITETNAFEIEHLKHELADFMPENITAEEKSTPLPPYTPAPTDVPPEDLVRHIGLSAKQCLEALSDCDDEQLNRYFIDPKQQQWPAFAASQHWDKREPGSTAAMRLAIREHVTSGPALTLDWIQHTHRSMTDRVSGLNGRSTPGNEAVRPGHWRTTTVRFGMNHFHNASEMGLNQCLRFAKQANALLAKTGLTEPAYSCLIYGEKSYTPMQTRGASPLAAAMWHAKAIPAESVEVLVQAAVDQYCSNLDKCRRETPINARRLIACCVELAQAISLIHPFRDANLRLAVQVLNKALTDNGLPMTLLREPSLIEGMSSNEMVNEVLQGMHYFKHFINTGFFPTTEPAEFEQVNCVSALISEDEYRSLSRDTRQLLHTHCKHLKARITAGVINREVVLSDNYPTIELLLEQHYNVKALKAYDTDNNLLPYLLRCDSKRQKSILENNYIIIDAIGRFDRPLNWFLALSPEQQHTLMTKSFDIKQCFKYSIINDIDHYLCLTDAQQKTIHNYIHSEFARSGSTLDTLTKLSTIEHTLLFAPPFRLSAAEQGRATALKSLLTQTTDASDTQLTLTQYATLPQATRSYLCADTKHIDQFSQLLKKSDFNRDKLNELIPESIMHLPSSTDGRLFSAPPAKSTATNTAAEAKSGLTTRR